MLQGASMQITQKEVTGSARLLYNQVKILDGREQCSTLEKTHLPGQTGGIIGLFPFKGTSNEMCDVRHAKQF
jgi:hypothetical protein